MRVGRYPYPEQRLEVEDRMVNLSAEDLARVERENREVSLLWQRESPPRFSLPLAAPLASLPTGGRFGARRVFNDQPRSPHGGADYSVPAGTPVLAAEGGVAVLVADHFFAGLSVYLDHGGGLITMYFHLARADVATGQRVARGTPLGVVGSHRPGDRPAPPLRRPLARFHDPGKDKPRNRKLRLVGPAERVV